MLEKQETSNSKGKLSIVSEEIRTYILLLFTKELIKHSTEDFHKLEHTIKKKGTEYIKKKDEEIKKYEEKKKQLRKIYPKEPFYQSLMHRMPRPTFENELRGPAPPLFRNATQQKRTVPLSPPMQMSHPITPLNIPHPRLPPHLQYLIPTPTDIPINLGKLQDLADDPNVMMIQCDGPEEPVIVRTGQGMRSTNTILDKDEIDSILTAFSGASKIPLHEGIFKIVVGRFQLSAIISSVVGSKFIINKIIAAPPMDPPGMLPMPPPRPF